MEKSNSNSVKDSLPSDENLCEDSTAIITNLSINDISVQSQYTNIQNKDLCNNMTSPKSKNAKKKERLNQLKINMPCNNINIVQSSGHGFVNNGQNNIASVQNYLTNQVNPSTCNSSYLENLTHHPNYMYLQNVQQMKIFNDMQTIQSKPLVHSMINQSAVAYSEPTTPRYCQNAMYHPLLSQSFPMNSGANFHLFPLGVGLPINVSQTVSLTELSKTEARKQKKREKTAVGYTFEKFMPIKMVEEGLKNKTLIEGVLRINPKLFQHAYISTDRNEQDIFIDGVKNRNRALEGDVVVVQLVDSDVLQNNVENKQKKGKVVHIKEMVHSRTCIGRLKLMPDKNKQKALFMPRDNRIPRLNIPFISWPNNFYEDAMAYENTLFLAKILTWSDTRFALGKILHNIGQSGDMISETRAILAQTDLDVTPYGLDVQHLYPAPNFQISQEEINSREDCRGLCLFSIDPFNTRDIDDAVSCRELDNGNFEIGVHISDVSHFVTENTILDNKVAEKATTIYLVEKAYHMLPDELCMLCSLSPGIDKLAFSVFWEITKNAQVLKHRFSKTVIQSCCQLAYFHAQEILEDRVGNVTNFPKVYNGYKKKDVYNSIKILGEIASILRKKRFENGALSIYQPKVSFRLHPSNGLPESFYMCEIKESNQLIEEFMLLANMTVANKIYTDHPRLAFLRCHPSPSKFMLKQLAKQLQPMGIDLEISSAGDIHRSLLPYVGTDSKDMGKGLVLNMLCAKPMTRAKYFCADGHDDEDFHHYALNVPLYTHFTSPIRRYADIMVHRLLAASIKCKETPQWNVDKVRKIAAQCNKQKYNAKKAGELSTELYLLKYIEINSPIKTDAVVVDVKEKYIDVIIICMGLNRRIFFNNDFPGEFKWVKHEDGVKLSRMEVLWHATQNLPEVKQVIDVFSILSVQLHQGDEFVKVETTLLRPQSTMCD